jgi:hypothetical protein
LQAEIEIWGIKTSQLNNNFKSQNMTYKKAQPKIADSLSVFIDQIEKIEKNTESLQKVSDGLNKKIEIFHQFEPKINFKPLETINNKHIAVLEEMTFRINTVLNNHAKDLENERMQKDSFFFRFSIMIGFMFLVTVTTSYLSFKHYFRKEKAETLLLESEALRHKNDAKFVEFLNDNQLNNKYKKWLNK